MSVTSTQADDPSHERLVITQLASKTDTDTTRRQETNWQGLRSLLSNYDRRSIKDGPMWSPAIFDGGRLDTNVVSVGALVLDIDKLDGNSSVEHVKGRLSELGLDSVLHSSFSDRHDGHRALRGVIRLSRPVLGSEYPTFWKAAVDHLGVQCGRESKNAGRCWYRPACPPEAAPEIWSNAGKALDVDEILERAALAEAERSVMSAPVRPKPSSVRAGTSIEERARLYVERMPPAISGQGGHTATLKVALVLVQGFELQETTALAILEEYNQRCSPTWSDRELLHKIESAAKSTQVPRGWLLEDDGQMVRCENAAPQTPDEWPEPEPLPNDLAPVPAFPLELLPSDLGPWIRDIAERSRVPAELPGIPAMIALASLVGRRLAIRPKQNDDYTVIPNLYGQVIYGAGMLKSPSASAALAPLQALEDKAREEYEHRQADERVDKIVRDSRTQKIKNTIKSKGVTLELRQELLELEQEQVESARKRYIVGDATPEALHKILAENPCGVLVFRDELGALFAAMAREERSQDRELLLSGWAGNSTFPVDRIGRGSIHAGSICLSLFGTIQPDPLLRLVRKEVALGDGLIQRIQMSAWPDVQRQVTPIDRAPDLAAKEQANVLFTRLARIPAPEGKSVPYLRFDIAAQGIFDEWFWDNERRIRSGEIELPGFQAHLGKYRSLIPALSLLTHLGDGGAYTAGTRVGEAAILSALAWADYLERHARRIYERAAASQLDHASRLLGIIQRGGARLESIRDEYGINPRSLYRNSRAWDAKSATEACEMLVSYGWLREVRVGKATRFAVNPQAVTP